MAELREADFKKLMDKGELSGTYLLYGAEKFTLLQSVRKAVRKLSAGGFGDFNLQRFDGTTADPEEVAAAAEALPFFAEQKLVTVSDLDADALSASDLESYVSMIEDLPETTVLLLYLPSVQLAKRPTAKWKQLLAAKGLTLVEFPRRSNSDLERYLITFAEKRACILKKDLAKRMLQLCGNDLETLHNEISKLCGYVGEGEITRAHMDAALTVNTEAQIFALANAIIGGQYEKAYRMIHDLLNQNEEPVAIVAMLSSSYLNLYRAKVMVQSGRSVQELSGPFDYRGKEFVLRNSEQDSSRFSMETLRKSLDLLLEADLALKGGAGSSRDIIKRVVLEELVAKLLLAAQT